MSVVTHRIGGIVFRTELNARLPRILEEPFELFGIEDTRPDIHQFISNINSDNSGLTQPTDEERQKFSKCDYFSSDWLKTPFFQSKAIRNRLYGLPDLRQQVKIWVDDHRMFIRDFSLNRIDIYYIKKDKGYPPEHPATIPEYYVAANFQQILATFLPQFSAILLHCSGVIRGGRSALFVASDGGGKTTVLAQSNDAPVLNDDQIIIRKDGDIVIAHGTPLGVMTSGPCQAPVGALFMLEKASAFRLEPIPPSEVVQYLWAEHKNYTFFLPGHLKQRAFKTLCDLCYRVPVYLMQFSKDYVDWDAIDAAMEP